MLYHLLVSFKDQLDTLRVVEFITVRTAMGALTAFALSLLLGPWFIRKLR
jgi:hypothetical protein